MNPELELALALSERLVAARCSQRRAEFELAVLLAELVAGEHFRPLGYASMEEYASIVLDLTARQARDLLRIGKALPGLPKLQATLAAGQLDWTKARELVRVLVSDTEDAWIERAKSVPSRILELQVASRHKGQLPPTGDEPTGEDQLRHFSVKLESADYDLVRTCLAEARMDVDLNPEELDDGDLTATIFREWLTMREGRAAVASDSRYRVTVELCPSCAAAHVGSAAVSETIAAEMTCDAELVDLRPGPTAGRVTRTIPPAVRRKVLGRAKGRCEVPQCRNKLHLDVHHVHARALGGTHDPAKLVCLCDGHHRAVHRGYLALERRADGTIEVRRAGDASLG